MSKHPRLLGWLLGGLFVLGGGLIIYHFLGNSLHLKKERLAVAPQGAGIQPFSFVDQDSETVTNQAMKGKIVVVEYFFTTCKSICPIMNENMENVYRAFRNSNDVLILSHTVDPENDTVNALKVYSQKFDADPRIWKFLTGDKKKLYDQARNSYRIAAGDPNVDITEDFIHTGKFVLIDKKGRIRYPVDHNGNVGSYDGTDSKSVAGLISDIRYLQKTEP